MNLRSVDLNLLVTFEAVLAERSVSAAARRLGLTQSAVSHALRRLRELFGDQLVVRGPNGMEPTPRALQISDSVSQALAQIERVIDEQREFDPRSSERQFTLRISEYVAPFLLPALCARVRREAPRLTLRVDHFDLDDAGRVDPDDIQVRMASAEPPPAGSAGVRLAEDEFVVLMSRDHPQARRKMTLERYLELPHMKVAAAALGTNMIDDALARRGLRRTIALSVPSWFEMRSVIASTDLVAAMPGRWARGPAFSQGCVWQPLPLKEVTFAVDLRWRVRDARDPGHRWLCRLIANTMAPEAEPVTDDRPA
ncbi:MAG TPA: LysR family transcriptional regulator [Amycolatopsis sp.]|jgi:DNA-binding transcriptional LysR family regulator|nr:LysR family transcriptional regulator [Amycolatopsis sp.]